MGSGVTTTAPAPTRSTHTTPKASRCWSSSSTHCLPTKPRRWPLRSRTSRTSKDRMNNGETHPTVHLLLQLSTLILDHGTPRRNGSCPTATRPGARHLCRLRQCRGRGRDRRVGYLLGCVLLGLRGDETPGWSHRCRLRWSDRWRGLRNRSLLWRSCRCLRGDPTDNDRSGRGAG